MDEHPNATIIRRMAESDDLGPLDFVTDDVVWHVLGRDEPYRGKAEMQRGSRRPTTSGSERRRTT